MPRNDRKKFKAKVVRRMNNFEQSIRAHEMKGAQLPEEFDRIEEWYKIAKVRLKKFIMETYDKIPEKGED